LIQVPVCAPALLLCSSNVASSRACFDEIGCCVQQPAAPLTPLLSTATSSACRAGRSYTSAQQTLLYTQLQELRKRPGRTHGNPRTHTTHGCPPPYRPSAANCNASCPPPSKVCLVHRRCRTKAGLNCRPPVPSTSLVKAPRWQQTAAAATETCVCTRAVHKQLNTHARSTHKTLQRGSQHRRSGMHASNRRSACCSSSARL
jgi:hypothetical protein